MMPAATHFDPVIGVDIHMIQPPGPVPPLPIPHPYVGMHLDPFDYAPFIGSTILVNGVHRAIAGTTGKAIPPHIPIGGVFVPVLPANEHEAFMGAATVEFDGDAANFMALPCLSCQSIGMPPPPRLNPKKGTKITVPVLPLSVVLPVPKGPPVLIGGPPTISLMSLVSNMIGPLAQLFGMTKAGKKVFGAASKAADKVKDAASKVWRKAFAWMPPGFLKCKVLKAEPVDIRTGEVVVDQLDVELPGRIPLRWNRGYRSSRTRIGACGRGWDTPADARLELNEDGSVLFLDGESTGALFDTGPQRGPVREPVDGWLLDRSSTHWTVRKKGGLTWHFPIPAGRETLVDAVIDACGNWVQYQRGPQGLVRVLESAGRSFEVLSRDGLVRKITLHHPDFEERRELARFDYDDARRLVAVYDALEHPYRYAWHPDGRLARHTNRVGLSFHYTYDAAGRCVHSWGDGGLYDYHFRYDPEGRWTNWTDSLGHRWGVELDERGNVVSETDPLGGVTSYAYDEAGRTVTAVDPGGRATIYEWDSVGNPLSMTRPDGVSCRNSFDEHHNLVAEADAAGDVTRYTWTAVGQILSRLDSNGTRSRFHYNPNGDLLKIVSSSGGVLSFSYCRFGDLLEISSGSEKGLRQKFRRDILGDVSHYESNQTRRSYLRDIKGRLAGIELAPGLMTRLSYDAEDRLIEFQDALGFSTSYTYYGLNEVASCTYPDGAMVRFSYDTEENATAVTDEGGRTFRLLRDPLGRIAAETDYWGGETAFDFNASGDVIACRDACGRRVVFRYDELGRLVSRQAATGELETFGWDAVGRLIAASNSSAEVLRRFGSSGELLAERQSGEVEITNTWDQAGRRVGRRSSLGHSVKFGFDEDGRLHQIEAEGKRLLDATSYDGGLGESARLGAALNRTIRRNSDGQPLRLAVASSTGEQIIRRAYRYDALGRLAARRSEIAGDRAGSADFEYDSRGRITRSTPSVYPEPRPAGPDGTLLNEIESTLRPDGTRAAHAGGAHYIFDAAGFLIRRSSSDGKEIRLEWDGFGRLASAVTETGESVAFSYDALGRRATKTSANSSVAYAWDGDCLLGWRQSGATDSRSVELIHDGDVDRPFAWLEEGAVRFLACDQSGCPFVAFDEEGRVVARVELGPTGSVHSALHPEELPLRFAGQIHDAEVNLYYNRFRYFDPVAFAYVSQDPIGLAAGHRLYSYVPNVWGWIDPLGLNCTSAMLDANTLIRAIEQGEEAAVAAALKGRSPIIPVKAVREFLVKGDPAALRAFMQRNGARIVPSGSPAAAAALQNQATSLGRSLKPKDATIAAAAQREGVPVLTRDKSFRGFLNAVGIGGEPF